MHNDDHELTDELRDVAALLRQQRAQLDGVELDRIRSRATRLGSQPSQPATRKSTFMRSRSVITALLASGIVMSGGGAALGVSALVPNISASTAQYGSAAPDNSGVLGENAQSPPPSGPAPTGEPTSTTPRRGVSPANDGSKPGSGAAPADFADTQVAQPARQLAATSTSREELPFTGLAAIPILLIGLVLLASGAFLIRTTRRSPAAG